MKIEGYFRNIKRANETVEKLKGEGFKNAFTDINEHLNDIYSQRGLVGSQEISSLSAAVLGENNSRTEEASSPLAAASPMASGMGGFEEIASINSKVVVEVAESDIEKAKNIIKSMGGTTENPNVKRIPEGLDNIDEDDLILKNLQDK